MESSEWETDVDQSEKGEEDEIFISPAPLLTLGNVFEALPKKKDGRNAVK